MFDTLNNQVLSATGFSFISECKIVFKPSGTEIRQRILKLKENIITEVIDKVKICYFSLSGVFKSSSLCLIEPDFDQLNTNESIDYIRNIKVS